MKLLSNTYIKIILIVIISLGVFTAWEFGFERAYEKLLVGTTNIVVSFVKKETKIEIETNPTTKKDYFKVTTLIQGRKGSYPQEVGGLLQPAVIILSWQIFLFFIINRKSAFRALWINFLIFLFFQVIFLVLLTGYYNSEFQKFVFNLMIDTFYVIALILIIKDNMLYPIFKKEQSKKV